MKRLWFIPLLAVLVAAACVCCTLTVGRAAAVMDGDVAALDAAVTNGNPAEIQAACGRIEADWADWEERLVWLLYRPDVEAWGQRLTAAVTLARQNEAAECLAECAVCRYLGDCLRRGEGWPLS